MQRLNSNDDQDNSKKNLNHSEESNSDNSDISKSNNNKEEEESNLFLNDFDPKVEAYEKALYLVSICVNSEMYEDAVRYIDEMVKLKDGEPSDDQCNLIISAYKYFISEKRRMWKNMQLIENKDQNTKLMMNEIRSTYEESIIKACERFISLINNYILIQIKSDRNVTLFLRVKADHYRYMAEITSSQSLFNNKQNAFELYKQSYDISNKLDILDEVRLSVALNYSVFLYEILNKRINSIYYAKEALSRALINLKGFTAEEISDEKFKGSLNIVEILNHNVHAWYKEEIESNNKDYIDD